MKQNFLPLLIQLALIFLFTACHKDLDSEEKNGSTQNFPVQHDFLNASYHNTILFDENCFVPQLRKTIANEVMMELAEREAEDAGFLEVIQKHYGTPVWDASFYGKILLPDDFMVVPLLKNGVDSTESILYAIKDANGHFDIFLLKKRDVIRFLNSAQANPVDLPNVSGLLELFNACDCMLFCKAGSNPGIVVSPDRLQFRNDWLLVESEAPNNPEHDCRPGVKISYTLVWAECRGGGGNSGDGADIFGTTLGGGGSSGNPSYSFGATILEIDRMIALLEQFRIDENITVPASMLLDLVPFYCADEIANFNYCALEALKSYIASNTQITETNWNTSSPNRKYLSDIVEFLFENNNSPDAGKIVEVLLDIAAGTETPLTQQEFKELLDAFNLYFDDPENNAEQLFDALIAQNINPLAVDPAHAQLEGEYNEYDNGSGWDDFDVDKIWTEVGPIKQDFRDRYPNRLQVIEALFHCNVIGLAFEEAVLASLGIPKNTTEYNGRIPDGKVDDFISDNFTLYPQPFFIEAKARLGSTFDYSGTQPWAQFTAYLAYLEAHAYADNTIQHGLYLILPAGVSLAQTVKDAASAKNVPLYVSYVELKNNDVSQFRVKAPELVNFSNLNYSGHLIFG
ncbi:MAG: hypothetical protein ACKV1O_28260 [Saprospiraceae bacterium]